MSLEVQILSQLLGKAAADPAVLALTRWREIERFEDQGWVELKSDGISLMFQEEAVDLGHQGPGEHQRAIALSAIHLHREGHDGYSGFREALPMGVGFGDREEVVVRKLGPPDAAGGPKRGSVVARIPRWLRYRLEGNDLHLQFDESGEVEMVSIFGHSALGQR